LTGALETTMNRRRFVTALTAATGGAIAHLPVAAQSQSTLRILVGFPPGGPTDAMMRVIADRMRNSLDQVIIIDNKAGAGGRTAMLEARRAAPDGKTLVVVPGGALVIQPWLTDKLGYDPVKDFTPIAQLSAYDFALAVGPASPHRDIRSLLQWMKANPKLAYYGTPGAGTVPHFAGELIAQTANAPMTHVPYKGGAAVLQALMGNEVPLMINTAPVEQYKGGQVRVLAVTGAKRFKLMPDVPTLKESGYDVVADGFFALYGPAGMAPATVARVAAAVEEALRAPEVQDRIFAMGMTPDFLGPAQMAATQSRDYKRWEMPIKRSGFKLE
jgi:tripartite-type tricarboxylate transporter receptor subunit TctC